MLELVASTGWIGIVLTVMSLLATGVVLERYWFLRKSIVAPPQLGKQVLAELSRRESVRTDTAARISVLGMLIDAAVRARTAGPDAATQLVEAAARIALRKLETRLVILQLIGALAPMLGLLGTVVGMITVFNSSFSSAGANTDALAQGIAQALVTTVFGLIVGMPSLAFHRLLQRRIDGLMTEMQRDVTDFMHELFLVERVQQYRRATSASPAPAGRTGAQPAPRAPRV